MTKYRIVRDGYAGFEVQSLRWWWPFWVQDRVNTHRTIEDAKAYATELANREAVYLGNLNVARDQARKDGA